ncbi:MAG: NTP transferase domain-containing protein [Muribaculum sp.]|nr:NTP transferase domain-containing protein [Muribaculum sp.]
MSEIKRNAIIMAAGTASRFVPLSAEIPKGLLEVKGEILIERQIRQLLEAGVEDIAIVVGYKAEMFQYLVDKFGVSLVLNEDFNRFNNTSSVIRVLDKLGDTYICSSDNYFPENVFSDSPQQSFYSAKYADGNTGEYCISFDEYDNITGVTIGGNDSWYMVGHVYFSKDFSGKFRKILVREYEKEETRLGYWEDVFIRHLNDLPKMRIRRYCDEQIQEFDSIDELRLFDKSYIENTRSSIIKRIVCNLDCKESDLYGFQKIKGSDDIMFSFLKGNDRFQYSGIDGNITRL